VPVFEDLVVNKGLVKEKFRKKLEFYRRKKIISGSGPAPGTAGKIQQSRGVQVTERKKSVDEAGYVPHSSQSDLELGPRSIRRIADIKALLRREQCQMIKIQERKKKKKKKKEKKRKKKKKKKKKKTQ